METYKVLNRKAKNWWHYKKLRKMGRIEEARKLERGSILSQVNQLKKTKINGYYTICRIANGLKYFEKSSSCHAEVHKCKKYDALVISLGIPTIDTSNLSETEAVKLCTKIPMLKWTLNKDEKFIRDNGAYNTWSFVTFKTYKKILIENFGDKVNFYNC